MNRRKVFPLLGSLALAWPTVLRAQQPPDRRQAAQVAYLGTGLVGWRVDALRAGLRSEGFEEGRNLVLHVRTTADRYDLLRAAAEDVVRLGVDVIAARGDTAARAARAATSTIPIVVIGSSNPVAAGWAVSLARPGGNVTGVLNYGNELFPKRLELLAEAVPGVTDVGVMYSSGSVSQVASIRIAQEAAVRMGLRLVIREVNRAEDIEPALDAIASVGARAIAPAQSTLLANHVEQIAEGARRHALAGIFSDRSYVDAGGMMSYGGQLGILQHRAGEYAGRILKGATPADLPIAQVERLQFVINLRTARALGLAIPAGLISRADDVIE